jgi:hypothetical protein
VTDIAQLENLIDMFVAHGYSDSMDVAMARVTLATANAAKRFLRSIPPDATLPKIAPDGDGGVCMFWKDGPLITIDAEAVLAVTDPGTAGAQCYDDVAPDELQRLPAGL